MKRVGVAISACAIIILLITVVLSLSAGTEIAGRKAIIFDKKIVSAMHDISTKVPHNKGILSPNYAPTIGYFTGRSVFTPYSVNSYQSLLEIMDSKNYTFLLVFENHSDIIGLKEILKKEQLQGLSKDFVEIATYDTDFNRLHLYRRI